VVHVLRYRGESVLTSKFKRWEVWEC
jgi:hypothetical protein